VNIKEYISSGILEAYVLGELSDQERSEVEKNLALYPALLEELRLIEETQEAILQRIAVAPRAGLKAQILNNIPRNEAKVVQMESDARPWKFAAAAAIGLAVVSSVLAFNYWNKWRNTENDLLALRQDNARIAEDYNRVNRQLEGFEQEIEIISDPAFTKVMLAGTANAPEALAVVYWKESTAEVFLKVKNLKSLSQENQYQLWAIIDGKPVDAGVFDGNVAGIAKMKDIGKGAAAFAVTVEPRGGKATPSLETMQLLGNVKRS
jgi:anti-sigma-K factor RskA